MEKLPLTQEQIKTILKEITKKENGYLELLKLSLNSMMEAEREISFYSVSLIPQK